MPYNLLFQFTFYQNLMTMSVLFWGQITLLWFVKFCIWVTVQLCEGYPNIIQLLRLISYLDGSEVHYNMQDTRWGKDSFSLLSEWPYDFLTVLRQALYTS